MDEDVVSTTAAVVYHSNRVGVAVMRPHVPVDASDDRLCSFRLCEFEEPSERLLNLESYLLRLDGLQKVVWGIQEQHRGRDLKKALSDKGVEIVETKLAENSNLDFDLKTLLKNPLLIDLSKDAPIAARRALGKGLIEKCSLLSHEHLRNKCELKITHLDKFVRLDSAAVEALHLLPARDAQTSVLEIANGACSSAGKQLLRHYITHPLRDEEEIRKRQRVVETFFEDGDFRDSVRAKLKRVPDLRRCCRQLRALEKKESGAVKVLEILYKLFVFSSDLPDIAKLLTEKNDSRISEFTENLEHLSQASKLGLFVKFVDSVVDVSRAPIEYLVRPAHDSSEQLQELTSQKERLWKEIEALKTDLELGALASFSPKFEKDAKMTKLYGFHFRISKTHHKALSKVKQGSEIKTVKACVRWSTPDLRSLGERWASLNSAYQKAQSKLVKEALKVACTYLPLFEAAATWLSRLDVLQGFAHVARHLNWTLPRVGSLEQLKVIKARHPCVERTCGDFVSNSYDFERKKFVVVTGPNMGGKSTYIRTLGVCAVLAQMGSFVPCEEGSAFPTFDAVLCRVGASDAQTRGVSTFMLEMIEASCILQSATSESLVVVDELGRGTSTADGFGLAWAIAEALISKTKSYTLFATHFHELTDLSKHFPDEVSNKHAVARVASDKVVMLYEIKDGACDESYGINIAKMAGFPARVVEDAERIAGELVKRRKIVS